jgi:hypothetical protein
MGCALAATIVPIGILSLVLDARSTTSFWPGWTTVHSDETPSVMLASEWMHSRWEGFGFHFTQWINTLYAIFFFATYGTTSRMLCLYYRTWNRVTGLGKAKDKVPDRAKTLCGDAECVF